MVLFVWLLKYKFIIIFYLILIYFFYINRKNVRSQARVIFLLRTRWGVSFIERFSKKYKEWIVLFGYIGAGVGFIGMITISYLLIKGLISALLSPASQPGVSLVLPGVNLPGLGVLPFWYWIIAIFIIAVVHEFSHGIVAKAHDQKIKSTGLVLLGPILGAFVEPDEKKIVKEKDIVQYSVYSAGAFSNILLAFVVLIILTLIINPLAGIFVSSEGVTFDSFVNESYPIAASGISAGEVISSINNVSTRNIDSFMGYMQCVKPGEKIVIKSKNATYNAATVENPADSSKGFIGISNIKESFVIKDRYDTPFYRRVYSLIVWIKELFKWLFILSLGIGMFNLLPLPLVDGGRILQTALYKISGRRRGERQYRGISLFFLLVLISSLLLPVFF